MTEFAKWWNKHKNQVHQEFLKTRTTEWGLALEVIAENAWQASASSARKQVVKECVKVVEKHVAKLLQDQMSAPMTIKILGEILVKLKEGGK
jgi:hypothetical protein